MPKIFITAWPVDDKPPAVVGFAMAEDGTGLAQHWSSSKLWVKHDMGLTSRKKHDAYEEHYPNGYELVDLIDATDEELEANHLYMEALRINAQGDKETTLEDQSETREGGQE